MATEEQVKEQAKKKLSISRIPPKTKEEFKLFADEEFEGDFGMCLKWCLDQALEYQQVKSIYLSQEGLNKVAYLINSSGEDNKDDNRPQTLSGKKLNPQNKSQGGKK